MVEGFDAPPDFYVRVELECGLCGAAFTECVPRTVLTDERRRSRCAALALPLCSACESKATATAPD